MSRARALSAPPCSVTPPRKTFVWIQTATSNAHPGMLPWQPKQLLGRTGPLPAMRPTPPPFPADMLLGNDTIREVLSIVAADESQEAVGLHATERGNRFGRHRCLLGCLRRMPRRRLTEPGSLTQSSHESHQTLAVLSRNVAQACSIKNAEKRRRTVRCSFRSSGPSVRFLHILWGFPPCVIFPRPPGAGSRSSSSWS